MQKNTSATQVHVCVHVVSVLCQRHACGTCTQLIATSTVFADWATSVIHGLAILGVYHQFTRILIARFHLCDVMPTVDHVTRSLSDALDTRAVQLRLGAFLREEVATADWARHGHRRIHCNQVLV